MKALRSLLGPVGALGALFSLSGPADQPAFRPERGSSLTKTFTVSGEFSLDDFSMTVGGEDVGEMLGGIELDIETESTISVTDTYGATEGGRPSGVERTFDELEYVTVVGLGTGFGNEDQEITSSSDLEGSKVAFTWNDDDGAFDVAFLDEEGNDDLLEGLDEDMDLRALLPTGEVSQGDEWEVELTKLHALAMPGGDLSFRPDELEDADFGDFDVFEELLEEELGELAELVEGSCECTYAGSSEVDGVRLGEIHVTIEVAASIDLSGLITRLLEAASEKAGEEIPVSIELAEFDLDFDGEGVLLWNLDAGRMASFELSGEAFLGMDVGITAEESGKRRNVEISVEMSGSYDYGVETEE